MVRKVPRITQIDSITKHCIRCDCELILKTNWTKAKQKTGSYICNNCDNKRSSEYSKTAKGKLSHQKYAKSKKGEEVHKKYKHSKKGKLISDEYIQSKIGKVNRKKATRKYRESEKGKLTKRKANAKRRGFKDTELFPNPFADSVSIRWHHISDEFIVAIPTDIHVLYSGWKEHKELCMNVINQIYVEGD